MKLNETVCWDSYVCFSLLDFLASLVLFFTRQVVPSRTKTYIRSLRTRLRRNASEERMRAEVGEALRGRPGFFILRVHTHTYMTIGRS